MLYFKPKPSYKENAGSSVCVLRRDTEARSTEITPNEAKGSSQEEEPDESGDLHFRSFESKTNLCTR